MISEELLLGAMQQFGVRPVVYTIVGSAVVGFLIGIAIGVLSV